MPLVVLRTQQNPSWLRGRVVRHPLAVSHDDRIAARVSPDWVEVRQETAVQVRYGTVSSLTVRVPVSQPDLWQVQGNGYARCEVISPGAGDGAPRRYRLSFDPPLVDGSTLIFRFRLPMDPSLTAGSEVRRMIPWIEVEDGTPGTTTVELSMDREIRYTVGDPAWIELGADRSGVGGAEAEPSIGS